jgi:hypothetical protein
MWEELHKQATPAKVNCSTLTRIERKCSGEPAAAFRQWKKLFYCTVEGGESVLT